MYSSIEKYIEYLMKQTTPDKPVWNIEAIRQGKKMGWNYIDGCMMISLINLWKQTGNQKYFDFVKNFIDYYVDDNGNILGFKKEDYNLDNINEGRVLFDLYEATGEEKYLKGIETVYSQIESQPKNSKGSFWHKAIYHDQVWLDGLFMAQIFYYRYQKLKNRSIEPILVQFRNVEKYMKDDKTGLYYHGYDENASMFWANEKGLSSNFWLRSMGWYIAALSDITSFLDEGSKEKAEFSGYLKHAVDSVLAFKDSQTNLFWQVVNYANREGNYLETSGSALIAFAIMRGVNEGILDKSYFEQGKAIFDGICKKYLTQNDDGTLSLDGICLVAGLGPEKNPRRDGSYEYYISEPIVSTDAKGVAPFVMAFVELRKGM